MVDDGRGNLMIDDKWETPRWLFDLLNQEFRFSLDAAASGINFKCNGYCDQLGDGLKIYWYYHSCGGAIYLNPPYSKIAEFIKKAYEESLKGATVVCLIPARTDTAYWHDYCMKAAEIRFIRGRLKFENPEVAKSGSAPFPSVVVIFSEPPRQCEACIQGLIPPCKKPLSGCPEYDPHDLACSPIIGKTIEQPKKVK